MDIRQAIKNFLNVEILQEGLNVAFSEKRAASAVKFDKE